jgi:hypothetical protein
MLAPEPEAVKKAVAEAREARAAAEVAEARAIESRPRVAAAKEAAQEAARVRVEAGVLWAELPRPAALENEALIGLAAALQEQLDMERRRGDAWHEAALAMESAMEAMDAAHAMQVKAANRKGLKWGAISGAGAIILVAALL